MIDREATIADAVNGETDKSIAPRHGCTVKDMTASAEKMVVCLKGPNDYPGRVSCYTLRPPYFTADCASSMVRPDSRW